MAVNGMTGSPRPPVIILGMHRSGTTMLAGLLEELGLFLGSEKEANNEALFFLELNEWVLRQSGAAWDDVRRFDSVMPGKKHIILERLRRELRSRGRRRFLGDEKYRRYDDISELDIPWGWKDPRNTITAPLWAEIFPGAKFLHVYRNPVDVAASLLKRERKKYGKRHKRLLRSLLTLDFSPVYQSVRVMDISCGIGLWEDYTMRALDLDRTLGNDVMHVKYEDFLAEPGDIIDAILRFIGHHADRGALDIEGRIRIDRKYAFLRNGELVSVFEGIKDRDILRRLGYDAICERG